MLASPLRLVRRSRALLATTALLCSLAAAQQGEEVPFITSPDNVTLEMLSIAGVKTGDHVIDLGSGDGRVVIVAAKRFQATGLGVEIDPLLVQRSIANAQQAGMAHRVEFREQDLFTTDLSPATVVTMYLLPQVNLQLRPSLLALKPGTRIVSHDWDMGDWAPDRTTVLPVPDKKVGLEKTSKVHLWVVPARVGGLWCGSAPLRDVSLRLTQKHQRFEGAMTRRGGQRELSGRIAGTELQAQTGLRATATLQASEDELRVTSAAGPLGLPNGQAFRRAAGSTCD